MTLNVRRVRAAPAGAPRFPDSRCQTARLTFAHVLFGKPVPTFPGHARQPTLRTSRRPPALAHVAFPSLPPKRERSAASALWMDRHARRERVCVPIKGRAPCGAPTAAISVLGLELFGWLRASGAAAQLAPSARWPTTTGGRVPEASRVPDCEAFPRAPHPVPLQLRLMKRPQRTRCGCSIFVLRPCQRYGRSRKVSECRRGPCTHSIFGPTVAGSRRSACSRTDHYRFRRRRSCCICWSSALICASQVWNAGCRSAEANDQPFVSTKMSSFRWTTVRRKTAGCAG
jgi:hypothetical protein